tara:strand:- start:14 stop:349 length:336 start_codon:yes stop_codon:yes gene_type:complete
MKLTANQLIEINKSIPDIHVELEWYNGSGRYSNVSEEIYSSGFLIVFDLVVTGKAKINHGGFMEENTHSDLTCEAEIFSIRVYNSDGEKLTMLPKHEKSLNYNLLQNILPS